MNVGLHLHRSAEQSTGEIHAVNPLVPNNITALPSFVDFDIDEIMTPIHS
jgi:hypothetical protein